MIVMLHILGVLLIPRPPLLYRQEQRAMPQGGDLQAPDCIYRRKVDQTSK